MMEHNGKSCRIMPYRSPKVNDVNEKGWAARGRIGAMSANPSAAAILGLRCGN